MANPSTSVFNYFNGSKTGRRTGFPSYAEVALGSLQPGSDLVYSCTVDR